MSTNESQESVVAVYALKNILQTVLNCKTIDCLAINLKSKIKVQAQYIFPNGHKLSKEEITSIVDTFNNSKMNVYSKQFTNEQTSESSNTNTNNYNRNAFKKV